MCGIAGIVLVEPGCIDSRSVVKQMQAKLMHRGPDDCGMVALDHGSCLLAHTRLSILDLSPAGHQPMCNPSTGNWIVFNGEIYNFRELREELGGLGVGRGQKSEVNNERSDIRDQKSAAITKETQQTRNANIWASNSDTEVILRAYERWGLDCLKKLRGMFAFAIWDNQKKELILARDPYGIKPLYFYHTDRLFFFASEVRALLASGLVPRKLSRDGLVSYLQFGAVQDPLTMIEGVRSLLPGYCLSVKYHQNTISLHESRFSSSHVSESPVSDRREAVTTLRKILEESVRQHLVSDVPVGAFLSGGIDSSAVVALMTRVGEQTPKTFSVIFSESEFSEAKHAQLVATIFGTEHREILLSEDHLLSMLPDALSAMDQPTMDGINTFVVSKAVKEAGVTVALSGLGGDELFAGYPSFRRGMQLNNIARVPFGLRKTASVVGREFFNGSARRRKFWDMVESDGSPYAAYHISRRLFSPAEIAALTARRQISDVRDRRFEIRDPRAEISAPPNDVVNAISRYEISGYMQNTLLRDIDQMSMAHALEVRVPYVDTKVVDYVLGLPGKWKISGGRPKPLLMDVLGDLLPEQIWKRRKMGFTLPFQSWMRAGLKSDLDNALSDTSRFERFGLNGTQVRAVWNAFKQNPQKEAWSRPWALFVLKNWCALHDVVKWN
jgi:asparagine synthase (glutamine-hydrolysing)